MNTEFWGQTDVGLRREINQDSILADKKLSLFIVADGMGGHKGGEVASALAVETAREIFERNLNDKNPLTPPELITLAFSEASSRIYRRSTQGNAELMGMGTTMVLAFIRGKTLYLGNVGDSRAYLFRRPNLWQLTEDHSLISEQLRSGMISEADARALVARNVITRSVGFENQVTVDIIRRELTPGEMVLLCSDGLTSMVPDLKIAEICNRETEAHIVPECVRVAKSAGGDDNISVILIKAGRSS